MAGARSRTRFSGSLWRWTTRRHFRSGIHFAFDFAEKLAAIAPAGLDRVFFTNSGSESVDTALITRLGSAAALQDVGVPRTIVMFNRTKTADAKKDRINGVF